MVNIYKLEYSLYFILSKSIVQSFHDLLKLLDGKFAALVSVVGWKSLEEGEFFGRKNFVEFYETFFNFEL